MPRSANTASAHLGRKTAIGRLSASSRAMISAAQRLAKVSSSAKVKLRAPSMMAASTRLWRAAPRSRYSSMLICMAGSGGQGAGGIADHGDAGRHVAEHHGAHADG